MPAKQVMRDLRWRDTFRSRPNICKCEELSERTLSKHALVVLIDLIFDVIYQRTARENYKRENVHIMLFCPLT